MATATTTAGSVRRWLGRQRRDLQWILGLIGLHPRVVWFQWRARRLALRTDDSFSLGSVTRPADIKILLELARGRQRVVELGTATAWTAITLALADHGRRVFSYDPVERPEPQRYLRLVAPNVRRRIELVIAPGAAGPDGDDPVDLLYIDSSHERDGTIEEVRAWQPHLRPGALVVFDDYTNPDFPGVKEAVAALSLDGHQRGTMFVHRHAG